MVARCEETSVVHRGEEPVATKLQRIAENASPRQREDRMDMSRIRGPYVRFWERDEANLISSPHPTRLRSYETVIESDTPQHFTVGDV